VRRGRDQRGWGSRYRPAPVPRAGPSPKRRTVTGTSRLNDARIREPRGMSPASGTSTEILIASFMPLSSARRRLRAQSPSESFPLWRRGARSFRTRGTSRPKGQNGWASGLGSGLGERPVADAANGLDQVLVLRPELGPQPADMDVDGPGPSVEVVAPHLAQ